MSVSAFVSLNGQLEEVTDVLKLKKAPGENSRRLFILRFLAKAARYGG